MDLVERECGGEVVKKGRERPRCLCASSDTVDFFLFFCYGASIL